MKKLTLCSVFLITFLPTLAQDILVQVNNDTIQREEVYTHVPNHIQIGFYPPHDDYKITKCKVSLVRGRGIISTKILDTNFARVGVLKSKLLGGDQFYVEPKKAYLPSSGDTVNVSGFVSFSFADELTHVPDSICTLLINGSMAYRNVGTPLDSIRSHRFVVRDKFKDTSLTLIRVRGSSPDTVGSFKNVRTFNQCNLRKYLLNSEVTPRNGDRIMIEIHNRSCIAHIPVVRR